MTSTSLKQQNFNYNDNDVIRYDADLYHQKYGNKWKKLASSIRDIKQEDGSIIREYLIEDPAQLENLSEDEDFDQELEKLNSQFEKRRELETNAIIEYEIVDEHGNLIKLDNAEHLKSLATSVKSIKQADGSIVKEYLLNDPKVIDEIKSKMKRDTLVKHQQQQQHLDTQVTQNHVPTKIENNFKRIDLNKYEIRTKSGKCVQFEILNRDCTINEADLNEITSVIENGFVRQDAKTKAELENKQQNILINQLKSNSSVQIQTPSTSSAFKSYSTKSHNKMDSLIEQSKELNDQKKRSLSLNKLDNNSDESSVLSNRVSNDSQKQQQQQVTSEMTEKLILKLLLQQLVHQQHPQPSSFCHKF